MATFRLADTTKLPLTSQQKICRKALPLLRNNC